MSEELLSNDTLVEKIAHAVIRTIDLPIPNQMHCPLR